MGAIITDEEIIELIKDYDYYMKITSVIDDDPLILTSLLLRIEQHNKALIPRVLALLHSNNHDLYQTGMDLLSRLIKINQKDPEILAPLFSNLFDALKNSETDYFAYFNMIDLIDDLEFNREQCEAITAVLVTSIFSGVTDKQREITKLIFKKCQLRE